MADPVTASVMIGSKVVGRFAQARAQSAQESAQNAAAMANYLDQTNREAMASDRQNEKLMQQLYAIDRANTYLEDKSLGELFNNAAITKDEMSRRRADMMDKVIAIEAANEKSAMERSIGSDSATFKRIKQQQNIKTVEAIQDWQKEQDTAMKNLLERREAQLAGRQSEMIRSNIYEPGRAPTLFDNSSTFFASAAIGAIGDIAGGVYGYNKYKSGEG